VALPIRVLVVDDHEILRSGLERLLGDPDDIEVVGGAGDLAGALRLARTLTPDVITLDLAMPDGSGLNAIGELGAVAPEARIIVLTMHEDPVYVRTALAAGASGYVVKSAAAEALIGGIRAVHRGRLFIDVENAEASEALLSSAPSGADAPAPIGQLSARERQVLVQLARGHTNREIGEQLGLSVKTVESYRYRLTQKLGITSRAELTRLAVGLGLLNDDPAGAGPE
jgi:DNA-binding NarL/FixJ family response regulator